MNEQNLIIFVSLFAIGLALKIGYVIGLRQGIKDERNESENRATKLAVRKRREWAVDP